LRRRLTPLSPKLAALVSAAIHGGTTSFFLLNIGETFRFPNTTETLTKTGDNGWYKNAAGRRFRTGTGTAVVVDRRPAPVTSD
jgi:hypothetical protein